MKGSRKRFWIAVLAAVLVLAAAGSSFVFWALNIPGAEGPALEAVKEADASRLDRSQALTFVPEKGQAELGLIFYPGGRVPPEAYAPLAAGLAAQGYLVSIPRMTLNLAVFESSAAEQVIEAYPEVSLWVIGGHSLGGAMAAEYAFKHPDQIAGLVLLGSFPPSSADLSSSSLQVLSLYGTRDGLATPEEVLGASSLLPPDTTWYAIEGGNHAGFGYYGPQKGDLSPLISREEQGEQVKQQILILFQEILQNN
jgi:hypothetical protein